MDAETTTYQDDDLEQKIATLYELDRYRELLDLARPMLADGDCPEDVFAYAADAALQLDDCPQARSILTAGLAVHPRATRLLGVQLGLLNRLGLYRDALEIAATAVEIEPENSGIWYLTAVIRFNMHDFAGAQRAIESALEIDPVDADYIAMHAEILWALDKNDQALEVALDGLALEPDNAQLLMLRAKMEKKGFRVIPILKSLLRIDPLHQSGQAEYKELTSIFRRNCFIAVLVTLGHFMAKVAILKGYLPGVSDLDTGNQISALFAVVGLLMARERKLHWPLTFVFVLTNMIIYTFVHEQTGGFWSLLFGFLLCLLISGIVTFIFTWVLFTFHQILNWGVTRVTNMITELTAARRSGLLWEWLWERACNNQVRLSAVGGIVMGFAALCDPTGDGYGHMLMIWLAVLIVLLLMTMDINFTASFGGAFTCMLCSLPFFWLVQTIPAGLAMNVPHAVIALIGGCLATGLAWQSAANWGDD